ncbi:MAG: tRNA (5-methylaminomethyl-2-thiouridine)(34)-methyltransferase MnmD [Bacteroidetes bacterium]|nr:tRNA (5-methylaminomethyl-2-thiouridine)(34)-methyltransferase MnmD [Bacteroidota bacterium]
METRLIITGDGSHTLFVPSLNEHYHSKFGAIAESMHVYINNGLLFVSKVEKSLSILEVGFGTGLNAFLSCIEAEKCGLNISYTAFEPDPVDNEVCSKLNYGGIIQETAGEEWFLSLHRLPWNKKARFRDNFELLKIQREILDGNLNDNEFHCIYFDVFGPHAQPGMWTEEVFSKLFSCLRAGGILVTYCASGSVRRAMKSAGFQIEKLPGAPGKKEMTRARKII